MLARQCFLFSPAFGSKRVCAFVNPSYISSPLQSVNSVFRSVSRSLSKVSRAANGLSDEKSVERPHEPAGVVLIQSGQIRGSRTDNIRKAAVTAASLPAPTSSTSSALSVLPPPQ